MTMNGVAMSVVKLLEFDLMIKFKDKRDVVKFRIAWQELQTQIFNHFRIPQLVAFLARVLARIQSL